MRAAGFPATEDDRTGVAVYSWNVNGVRAASRKGFVDWLCQSDADIVAIQETRAAPEQLSRLLLRPPGYHADWCSATTRGYSGVATFSRDLPIEIIRGLGDAHFDFEGRVLISEFAQFVLINVYAPNGGRGAAWVDEEARVLPAPAHRRGAIYGHPSPRHPRR